MKIYLLGVAFMTVSAVVGAQTQSGSSIGSNSGGSASTNVPAPLPVPSTGTTADGAATRGTSPRADDTSVSTRGLETSGPASGRCDTLFGEERAKCLREQASAGTTGPASTGMSTGATR
jgi:hypothetical protein